MKYNVSILVLAVKGINRKGWQNINEKEIWLLVYLCLTSVRHNKATYLGNFK